MSELRTTHGTIDEARLSRTVGFEDRPTTYVVWVEWRLPHNDDVCAWCQEVPPIAHMATEDGILVRRDAFPLPKETNQLVYTTKGDVPVGSLRRTIELTDSPTDIAVGVVWTLDGELVRRDAHVIGKQLSLVAEVLAGSFT